MDYMLFHLLISFCDALPANQANSSFMFDYIGMEMMVEKSQSSCTFSNEAQPDQAIIISMVSQMMATFSDGYTKENIEFFKTPKNEGTA